MKTGILLFDNFIALDAIGPYDVLNRLPGVKVIFIGLQKKQYKDQYGLTIAADYAIDDIQELDILLIPGGFGIDNLLTNQHLINRIKQIDANSTWTVSVCSGALLLAQAGLLDKKQCTTHWRRKEQLKKYNVTVVNERYIQDGKYITSAGVSAGIDMALYLAGRIAGDTAAKMIQLGIEYNPKPPFEYGSIEITPEFFEKSKK